MFNECSALTEIDLSGWDTSSVDSMGYMFFYCSSLGSLDVSGFDTSSVTDMNSMFGACSALTTLDLSNFDTSSVTRMDGMFSSCSALTTLDLSNFDTSSVTDMGYMFGSNTSLTSLNVSGWDTSSVNEMESMFSGCSSLASLDVSNWDTSSVTGMGSMFNYCSSLTSLDLSGWDTSLVSDMHWMFEGCSSLALLDVSGWDTSSVTNMEQMFHDCSSLASLDLSSWNTSLVPSFYGMFNYCSSLASLDVSGWDTSSVEDIDHMFDNCSSLSSLDLSSWDSSSISTARCAFSGCSSLLSLDLSGWDTSGVEYMDYMFSECDSLRSLTVGEGYQIKGADMFPDATSDRGWWSVADEAWYAKDEICANRSGVADTYRDQVPGDTRDISLCEVTLSELSYDYDGTAKVPSVTVRDGSATLVDGTDYELSYADNVDAGTATVTVAGIGGYGSTYAATFEIMPLNVGGSEIASIPDQPWTGSAITPLPEVVYYGKTLVAGVDYELSYNSNTAVGTATVIATGKGNYTGIRTATFKIVKRATSWKRLAGNGRYDTMARIVQEGWKSDKGGVVVLANGYNFKDALAAAGFAGIYDAPIVLTDGGRGNKVTSLSSQARSELVRLAPSVVYVAGGPFAVPEAVVTQVRSLLPQAGIVRVAGDNGCSTSAELAQVGDGSWGDTAIIATDKSFKDALSVAPVSYAKHWPILLAGGGKSLNKDVLAALRTCGIERAYIVGGELAVTPYVVEQLQENDIELAGRLAGKNGIETSRKIAEFALKNGLTVENMAFATSQNFPDALGGAALCGKNNSVLLLCDDKAKGNDANMAFAESNKAGIQTGYVFGGESAFSKGLYDRLPR